MYKVDDQGHLVKIDSKITPKLNLLQKTLVITAAFLYSAVVGLARYYEKADTLNQILFGWALGVWLAVVFAIFVRDPLFTHVKGILEVRTEDSYFKRLIIFFCLNLALMSVNVIIYFSIGDLKYTLQYEHYLSCLDILIGNNKQCY